VLAGKAVFFYYSGYSSALMMADDILQDTALKEFLDSECKKFVELLE
jgi:hypothetical protein